MSLANPAVNLSLTDDQCRDIFAQAHYYVHNIPGYYTLSTWAHASESVLHMSYTFWFFIVFSSSSVFKYLAHSYRGLEVPINRIYRRCRLFTVDPVRGAGEAVCPTFSVWLARSWGNSRLRERRESVVGRLDSGAGSKVGGGARIKGEETKKWGDVCAVLRWSRCDCTSRSRASSSLRWLAGPDVRAHITPTKRNALGSLKTGTLYIYTPG